MKFRIFTMKLHLQYSNLARIQYVIEKATICCVILLGYFHPPQNPVELEIRNGDDVRISWGNYGQYNVWRGDDSPYVRPGDEGATYVIVEGTGWTHYDGVGNPAHNTYYVVEDSSGGQYPTACSAAGEFDFAIVPGS